MHAYLQSREEGFESCVDSFMIGGGWGGGCYASVDPDKPILVARNPWWFNEKRVRLGIRK